MQSLIIDRMNINVFTYKIWLILELSDLISLLPLLSSDSFLLFPFLSLFFFSLLPFNISLSLQGFLSLSLTLSFSLHSNLSLPLPLSLFIPPRLVLRRHFKVLWFFIFCWRFDSFGIFIVLFDQIVINFCHSNLVAYLAYLLFVESSHPYPWVFLYNLRLSELIIRGVWWFTTIFIGYLLNKFGFLFLHFLLLLVGMLVIIFFFFFIASLL